MLFRHLLCPACLLSVLVCHLGSADTVLLDNDSRLVGEVTTIRDGKVALKTDFAGTLSIPLDRVVALQTDHPLRVAVGDRQEEGTVSLRGETCEVQTVAGPLVAPLADLLAAGPADQPLVVVETPAPPRRWAYEAGAFYRGKSGNTDSTELSLSAKAERKGDKDRLKLYTTWENTEKNDSETEDELIGGVDYERELSKLYSWYARTELERDGIEQLSLRSTLAGGMGYYLARNKVRELRLRSGLQYRRETYDSGEDDSQSIGLEFGLSHSWQIATWGKLVNNITYTAAFDNWADYRVVHESSLDLPLAKSRFWKIRLGLAHEYNSISADDTEDLDTTYFVKLVFNWR